MAYLGDFLVRTIFLRGKAKGEDTARADLKSARGKNGFALSASGNFTVSHPDSGGHTRTGNASLSASLPLYTGGANEANIRSGEIGLDTARLATERERENLRYNVIKAYYDVLEAQRTVAIDQESVDKYQAHLTNVELLYQAGSKARLDVLRSSVELANARQTLIKAQNEYE
ncbi:MAG: TolC family protein, partial [Capnocytophaga granulosa]